MVRLSKFVVGAVLCCCLLLVDYGVVRDVEGATKLTPEIAADARTPVVLSTDVGNEIDDQWTIAYLLFDPRVEVLGVMSAHAPSIAAPAGRTSHRILRDVVENRLGMRTHPPLVEGASLPLENAKTPRPSPAASFLVERSKPYTPGNRLTVLMIGAGTDVASAILIDPSIVDRIRIVQMGFNNERGGDEFNVLNDVRAVQVIFDSDVPLVIGSGEVCRASLSLSLDQAREMVASRGEIGAWLYNEFAAWYFRMVKPLRQDDYSKPWIIWDNITLAYVLGMTEQHTSPRPRLKDDVTFEAVAGTKRTVVWITDVDERRMWADYLDLLDEYQRTHAVSHASLRPRLTFLMP